MNIRGLDMRAALPPFDGKHALEVHKVRAVARGARAARAPSCQVRSLLSFIVSAGSAGTFVSDQVCSTRCALELYRTRKVCSGLTFTEDATCVQPSPLFNTFDVV